jgi:hypothetical protein
MSENMGKLVRREVRSPRVAAIAGIVYALLTGASMILLINVLKITLADISSEWLEAWSSESVLVLLMVSFAGIAFLWFMGVMLDLGGLEDKFFATIFLGSGFILVTLMFVWAAALGAIFGTYALAGEVLANYDVFVYASVFISQIIGSFSLPMQALFMLSIATLWRRTNAVPRWMTNFTYIVGVPFLVFAAFMGVRVTSFVFPAWVLLVSVYILIKNFRFSPDQEDKKELSLDN